MKTATVRAWSWVHRWASLVCTVFMLVLALTGLPLIFSDEIEHWTHAEIQPKNMPPGTPDAPLDRVLAAAQQRHPKLVPMFLSREAAEPALWLATLGPTADAQEDTRVVIVDARSAQVVGEPRLDEGFMHVMLRLHVDLFAGLPGSLFLGLMGLLLVLAIVSGVVLYGPFMKRLEFGTVRQGRSRRLRWLDLHNLLGIVSVVWLTVVGITGVINTLGEPAIGAWQQGQLQEMTARYKGRTPDPTRAPLQPAVDAALAAVPGLKLSFIAFPGSPLTSPHHYGVYLQGSSPFSSRLFTPVLVDARSGVVTDSRELPWYIKTILVSQPFHFGNYGGLPMKLLWVLLDIVTIVVLVSGLYLWLRKGKAASAAGPVSAAQAS